MRMSDALARAWRYPWRSARNVRDLELSALAVALERSVPDHSIIGLQYRERMLTRQLQPHPHPNLELAREIAATNRPSVVWTSSTAKLQLQS